MKKVLAIIIYLVCGLVLAALSAVVKSEEVTHDKMCPAGIGSDHVRLNPDFCDPDDAHEEIITYTKYGFPLNHASYTTRHYIPPFLGFEELPLPLSTLDRVMLFFEHPNRHFYQRELALNIIFWAFVCAGLHYIKKKIFNHKKPQM